MEGWLWIEGIEEGCYQGRVWRRKGMMEEEEWL